LRGAFDEKYRLFRASTTARGEPIFSRRIVGEILDAVEVNYELNRYASLQTAQGH